MFPSDTVDSVVAHVDSLNASAAKVNKALFGRSAREEESDDDEDKVGGGGLASLRCMSFRSACKLTKGIRT